MHWPGGGYQVPRSCSAQKKTHTGKICDVNRLKIGGPEQFMTVIRRKPYLKISDYQRRSKCVNLNMISPLHFSI